MGVRFACHACQHRLNVKSELAGKKGKCPSCGTRFRIPINDSDFSLPLESHPPFSDSSQSEPSGVSEDALPDRATAEPEPTAASTPEPKERTSPSSEAAAESRPAPAPPPPPAPPLAPAPKDLLDADPSAMWYVRPPSGGQYGPATGPLLKEWIGEGRVAAASLLWREGWAQWRRAEEVVPSLVSSYETATAVRSKEAGERSLAAGVAAVGPVAGGGPPEVVSGSAERKEDPPIDQPPPPGRIKRQRKLRRVTTIGILVGLSILLLIVLIFVILGGLGE